MVKYSKYKFKIGDRVNWIGHRSIKNGSLGELTIVDSGFIISRYHDGHDNEYVVEWDKSGKSYIVEDGIKRDDAYHKMKEREQKLNNIGI